MGPLDVSVDFCNLQVSIFSRWLAGLGWLVGLEVENRKLSEIGLDGVGGQHSTANSMQNCKTKKRKSGIQKY